MVHGDVVGMLAQFGMAGLIAWMWLTERRAGLVREKQIEESHRRLAQEREALGVVLGVIEANTRAMVSLELGQRELAAILRGLTGEAGACVSRHAS